MTYTIEDADDQLTDSSYIEIKVRCLRAKPIAKPDEETTDDETPVTVDPLVDNGNGADEDPENDPLTVISIGTPGVGTAVLNDDGTVTYTPDDKTM